ncbi:hypothetical protein SNEBB_001312 [Seison nebaliae]|nr:hypothetical protein SNEBB_001312 [Seison nebaliae]
MSSRFLLNACNVVRKFNGSIFKNVKRFNSQTTKIPLRENDRVVGGWCLLLSGFVGATIVVGGATRLTESGLSMVQWHAIKDMMKPKNEEEWEKEFAKYKQFPEWKYLNSADQMDLDGFKKIYYLEWLHRNLGKLTGMMLLLPASFFFLSGRFRHLKGIKGSVGAMTALVGAQGAMGWYMVKSGLNEPNKLTNEKGDLTEGYYVPRVSQYRLAAHLGLALVLYVISTRTGFKLLLNKQKLSATIKNQHLLKPLSTLSHLSLQFTFLTALSGAFVAGLDAGLIYNTFPMMADRWIPSDLFALEPLWKNFFENGTTAQFTHRCLATTTLSLVIATVAVGLRCKLPPRTRKAILALGLTASAQFGLGVSTLLNFVPTNLSVAHQGGAVTLLTMAIWLLREMKMIVK